jgi:hypothetical protein
MKRLQIEKTLMIKTVTRLHELNQILRLLLATFGLI